MTLQDYANIRELLGGIGVIATLVYLAIQIRHNTQSQRNDSRVNTTRGMTQWYFTIMADSELVTIFDKGFLDTASLSTHERARFMWMMAALGSRVEEIYSQYEAGLINDDLWTKYRGVMASTLENEVVKEWWDSKVTPFTDGFRNAIDCTPNAEKNWDPRTLRVLTGEDN